MDKNVINNDVLMVKKEDNMCNCNGNCKCEKENNNMDNKFEIKSNDELKNIVDFTINFQSKAGACTPIIDGEPCVPLTFGYTSEADKIAAQNLIKDGLKATGGDIWATIDYIRTAMLLTANDISPDKAVTVEVDGINYDCMISFKMRTIYFEGSIDRLADLSDLGDVALPDETIEILLKERASNAIRNSLEKDSLIETDPLILSLVVD